MRTFFMIFYSLIYHILYIKASSHKLDGYICNKKEYVQLIESGNRYMSKDASIKACRRFGYQLFLPDSEKDLECIEELSIYLTATRYTYAALSLSKNGTWIRDDDGKEFNQSFIKISDYAKPKRLIGKGCLIGGYEFWGYHNDFTYGWFNSNCNPNADYLIFPICQKVSNKSNEISWREELEAVNVTLIRESNNFKILNNQYTFYDAQHIGPIVSYPDDLNKILHKIEIMKHKGQSIPTTIWVQIDNSSDCNILVTNSNSYDYLKTYPIDCNSKASLALDVNSYICNGKHYTLLNGIVFGKYKHFQDTEQIDISDECNKKRSKLVLPKNHQEQLCVRKILSFWPSSSGHNVWLDPKLALWTRSDLNAKYSDYSDWTGIQSQFIEGKVNLILLRSSSRDSDFIPGKWAINWNWWRPSLVLCERKLGKNVIKMESHKKVTFNLQVIPFAMTKSSNGRLKFPVGKFLNNLFRKFERNNYTVTIASTRRGFIGGYKNRSGYKYEYLLGELEQCKIDIGIILTTMESPLLKYTLIVSSEDIVIMSQKADNKRQRLDYYQQIFLKNSLTIILLLASMLPVTILAVIVSNIIIKDKSKLTNLGLKIFKNLSRNLVLQSYQMKSGNDFSFLKYLAIAYQIGAYFTALYIFSTLGTQIVVVKDRNVNSLEDLEIFGLKPTAQWGDPIEHEIKSLNVNNIEFVANTFGHKRRYILRKIAFIMSKNLRFYTKLQFKSYNDHIGRDILKTVNYVFPYSKCITKDKERILNEFAYSGIEKGLYGPVEAKTISSLPGYKNYIKETIKKKVNSKDKKGDNSMIYVSFSDIKQIMNIGTVASILSISVFVMEWLSRNHFKVRMFYTISH